MLEDEILKFLETISEGDIREYTRSDTQKSKKIKVIDNKGTSYFIYFGSLCVFHQMSDEDGGVTARDMIEVAVISRFVKALKDIGLAKKLAQAVSELLNVKIRHKPNVGYDNGEVYLWIEDYRFQEEFSIKLLLKFKQILKEHPIRVLLPDGEEGIVVFSGWGFGYI